MVKTCKALNKDIKKFKIGQFFQFPQLITRPRVKKSNEKYQISNTNSFFIYFQYINILNFNFIK